MDRLASEQKRRQTCNDKLTWQTREEAIAARAYAAWQYGPTSDRPPKPYLCSICSKWHLARSYDDSQ